MELLSHVVKFNSQTNGRDRLCRLCQYTSKLCYWSIEKYGDNKELLVKLKDLESSLSATRKVMRMGKSLDLLQGAVKSMSVSDLLVRSCLVTAKTSQAAYLLLDNYIWFGKQGLLKVDTKKYGRRASRLWLVTLTFLLLRNLYDILTIVDNEKRRQRKGEGGGWGECLQRNRPVVVDTVKNLTDVFLPLSSLKIVEPSMGFVGLMGMISSTMGLLTTWDAQYKLSPS